MLKSILVPINFNGRCFIWKQYSFSSIFSKKKLITIEILLPLTISVTGHFRIFHILSAELQVPLTRTLPWHKQSHHFCYKFTTEMCVCTLIICCDQRAICETMASDKNRLGRRKVRVHTERDGRWSYTFTFSKGSHTGHNYKKSNAGWIDSFIFGHVFTLPFIGISFGLLRPSQYCVYLYHYYYYCYSTHFCGIRAWQNCVCMYVYGL